MNSSQDSKKNTTCRTSDLYVGHVPKDVNEVITRVYYKTVDILFIFTFDFYHRNNCYALFVFLLGAFTIKRKII